jgi:predicted MFS family arabinose efflux permease
VLLAAFLLQQLRRDRPMLDPRLFRKPAFTGVQLAAFSISASLFAMFLYITLFLQEILGYSPLQAGLRFLPISLLAFVAAPIGGRLTGRVPIRLLMGGGLALVAASMALLTLVGPTSSWTALLPGFIVGGIGIGVTNPALATTAISTVPREQAGVGSGVNSTFRQVGIATGIAGLGAIFQHQLTGSLGPGAHTFGGLRSQAVPPIVHAAFVSALHDILWVGTGIAAAGAVLAFVLVRGRDFLASGPAAAVD